MADATPIRKRMIEDMTMRGFASGTQRAYIRAARHCATHAWRARG